MKWNNLLLLLIALSACSRLSSWTSGENHTAEASEHNLHHNHSHNHEQEQEFGRNQTEGQNEPSDLDQPLSELFTAQCEHGVLTHQCAECRYEVGVVKVPEDLLTDGLIEVETVGNHPLISTLNLTGEVGFDERRIAHMSPPIEGIIKVINVDRGQQVKAGDPLVELDSIDLAAAKSDFLEARAVLALSTRNHARQEKLRQARITSEREYLTAVQELESSKIRANSAQERLIRLGLSSDEIKKLIRGKSDSSSGRLVIKAPFDGTVIEAHAPIGELAEPGKKVITVGDLSRVWVWVDLYEIHLQTIENNMAGPGIQAEVRVNPYAESTFTGTVDYISAVMDERTRTVKTRISLDNPEGKLRPGMFCQVVFTINISDSALTVPRQAVLSDEGRDFIFVHHHGEYYVRRPVKLGQESNGLVEIKEGVEPGQQVVIKGAFMLKSDVLRSKMGAGCAD